MLYLCCCVFFFYFFFFIFLLIDVWSVCVSVCSFSPFVCLNLSCSVSAPLSLHPLSLLPSFSPHSSPSSSIPLLTLPHSSFPLLCPLPLSNLFLTLRSPSFFPLPDSPLPFVVISPSLTYLSFSLFLPLPSPSLLLPHTLPSPSLSPLPHSPLSLTLAATSLPSPLHSPLPHALPLCAHWSQKFT